MLSGSQLTRVSSFGTFQAYPGFTAKAEAALWTDITDASTTWSDISDDSSVWTDISDDSTTWND